MKLLTPVLLFGLLTLACGKDNISKIERKGYLLHAVTYQPIVGQEIRVRETRTTAVTPSSQYPTGQKIEFTEHISVTDATGKFSFLISKQADGASLPILQTKEWIVSSTNYFWGRPIYYANPSRIIPDTILVERPGYIRYEVNNINDRFTNDSLWVATPYQLQGFAPEPGPPQFPGPIIPYPNMGHYNWLFVSDNVSKIVTDTIPAEKYTDVQVEWAYKRTGMDTITKVKENIHVSPGTTTTYKINY
jgi:hypothetical protein